MPSLKDVFRLYLITDDAGRSARELAARVDAALRGGVTAVQLREKSVDRRALAEYVLRLGDVCKSRGVPLLLNGALWFPELPLDFIDGIHLQAATWPVSRHVGFANWLERHPALVRIYSAHSVEEAAAVAVAGVPAVTMSPIFPTPSKEGILPPLGVGYLESARRALSDTIIVGLGGIRVGNARDVIRAGADGVAVIRAILTQDQVERAAARLRQEVELALAERFRP